MNEKEYISRWNLLRRNIFINKRFQTDFSIKFLVLIVIESLLAIGLFVYFSRGTVITGYSHYEPVIESTGEYFLPVLLLTNLVVIGVTAAVGFVVMLLVSHKIAGPLYRFEKALDETSRGDLTSRFNIRSDDQLQALAEKMNEFNSRMDASVSDIQRGLGEALLSITRLREALSREGAKGEAEPLAEDALKRLRDLERAALRFKTTHTSGKEGV